MKTEVLSLASGLGPNQTRPNQVCPFCKADERSFSVTRLQVGVLYNCFRAKCGKKGFIPTLPHELAKDTPEKEFKPRVFSYPLRNFSTEEVSKHFSRYEIGSELVELNSWKYDYTNGRVAIPLLGLDGRKYGYEAKLLKGETKWAGPKSVVYLEKDRPTIHFPEVLSSIDDWLVVVEDAVSAVKVSQICEAVALLGTHMSKEAAAQIAKVYRKIIVMLDPGAENQANKIITSYNLYFDAVRLVFLEQDPKDTPFKKLKRAIDGTISSFESNPIKNGIRRA